MSDGVDEELDWADYGLGFAILGNYFVLDVGFMVTKIDCHTLRQVEVWIIMADDLGSIPKYYVIDPDGLGPVFPISDKGGICSCVLHKQGNADESSPGLLLQEDDHLEYMLEGNWWEDYCGLGGRIVSL